LPRDATTEHPGYGCTPQRLVQICRDAENGQPATQCELFDDIRETDAHTRNLFEQRSQAVAGKPRVIKTSGPDPDDAIAANALAEACGALGSGGDRPGMTELMEHLLGFNQYGYSGAELHWDVRRIEGRDWIVPVAADCVPARRFVIVPRTEELRLINDPLLYIGGQPEPLWPGKWIIVRRSPTRLARSGLMRTAAWYSLFKRLATRDWVVYAEKFGIPLPIVSYDDTIVDEAKDIARLIAENIGNDGAAVVPKGIDVNLVDASRGSDSSGTHGGLITYCNRELSKLVNGSTLSNDNGDSGGASYALGDVHASVRWEADPKVRVEMGEKLLAMGVPLSLSQMRQDSGFAAPINDDDTIKPLPAPAPTAPTGPASGGTVP
jgi:phage gp29-like protein